MAKLRDPGRKNRSDGFGHIPYPLIGPKLLKEKDQCLVPFLGAGASRPFSSQAETQPEPVKPELLNELMTTLNVQTDDAKMFLEIALAVIGRLNLPVPPRMGPVFDAVRDSTSAPSAAELAQALAEKSQYDFFDSAKQRVMALTGRTDWDNDKLTHLVAVLARLTALGSASPPLLDASSYLAYHMDRKAFWSDLHRLFANKTEPTATHKLVALAASQYIEANKAEYGRDDFLIVTTNYDSLLETALDAQNTPYYVLTVPRGERRAVSLRFSDKVQPYFGMNDEQFKRVKHQASFVGDQAITTTLFSGLSKTPKPLVMIYKIHGSLDPQATPDTDSVVITNEDYVAFLSLADAVPSYVRTRLPNMGLLLLGYSFSDWNVRSLYRSMTQYRAALNATPTDSPSTKDYAVLLNPSPYEMGFFDFNRIDVFDTTLDLFCQRMQE